MEAQMEEWYKEVGQLQVQVTTIPQQTQIKETVAERQAAVEARMVRLIEPLKERRRILLASKEVHQVGRDLEDEIVSLMTVNTHLFPSLKKIRVVGLGCDGAKSQRQNQILEKQSELSCNGQSCKPATKPAAVNCSPNNCYVF